MEELHKRRWVIVLFFLLIGALLIAFIYAASVGPRNPYYRSGDSRGGMRAGEAGSRTLPAESVQLYKDRVQDLGKIRLIYHGMQDGIVSIGVIIPALDPDVSYNHEIPIQEAKEELRVGDMRFRVTSAGSGKLRLERIDSSATNP